VLPHAFEASSAPNKRRENYKALNNLAQYPTTDPRLTLTASYFGAEIGASPTFGILPGREWSHSSRKRRMALTNSLAQPHFLNNKKEER
jgi:hypothetical protein